MFLDSFKIRIAYLTARRFSLIRWLNTAKILLTLVFVSAYPPPALASLNSFDPRQLAVGSGWEKALGVEPQVYSVERPPTLQSAFLEICRDRGYGEDCAKTLLGMAWKETNFVGNAVGDGGRAFGYFQIHYRLHGITKECARDLRCAADWTISYLEQNGYPEYKKVAIQCHNGCGVANGYAASVIRHGDRLWGHDLAAIGGSGAAVAVVAKSAPSKYQAALASARE